MLAVIAGVLALPDPSLSLDSNILGLGPNRFSGLVSRCSATMFSGGVNFVSFTVLGSFVPDKQAEFCSTFALWVEGVFSNNTNMGAYTDPTEYPVGACSLTSTNPAGTTASYAIEAEVKTCNGVLLWVKYMHSSGDNKDLLLNMLTENGVLVAPATLDVVDPQPQCNSQRDQPPDGEEVALTLEDCIAMCVGAGEQACSVMRFGLSTGCAWWTARERNNGVGVGTSAWPTNLNSSDSGAFFTGYARQSQVLFYPPEYPNASEFEAAYSQANEWETLSQSLRCPDQSVDADCYSDGAPMYAMDSCGILTESSFFSKTGTQQYAKLQCLRRHYGPNPVQHPTITGASYPSLGYNYERDTPGYDCYGETEECTQDQYQSEVCLNNKQTNLTGMVGNCSYIVMTYEGASRNMKDLAHYEKCVAPLSLSPSLPPPPGPPPGEVPIIITGDPHVHFAHGGSADYRGEDGAIVCFFSAPGIALNIKTEDATFTPPWWPGTTIEGSYITEVTPPSSPLPLPGQARDTARLAHRRTSSHAWAEPSASGQTLRSLPHGSPSSTRALTSSPAPAAATPSRLGLGRRCDAARSSPSSRTTRLPSLRRPLSRPAIISHLNASTEPPSYPHPSQR